MSEASDIFREYFTEHFNHIYVDPLDGEIALHYGVEHGCWLVRARMSETRRIVTVVSHCPVLTPVDRRREMCEYLQRCHNGILDGHFELDFRDGEVLFRTAHYFGAADLEAEHVDHLFGINVSTVKRYLPGMMAVGYGDVAPAEAVDLPVWPERLLEKEFASAFGELLSQAEGRSSDTAAAQSPAIPDGEESDALRRQLQARLHDLLARLVAEADEEANVSEQGKSHAADAAA